MTVSISVSPPFTFYRLNEQTRELSVIGDCLSRVARSQELAQRLCRYFRHLRLRCSTGNIEDRACEATVECSEHMFEFREVHKFAEPP